MNEARELDDSGLPAATPANKRRYEVLTWDMDLQQFTPQKGVRRGPYTQFGLRKALRKLQTMGYDITRAGGVSIMVERVR